MNRYDLLKDKLETGKTVRGMTFTLFAEPLLIPKMKRDDLDFLLFDGEHGRCNIESLVPALNMCRTMEIPSIVRVPDAQYHLIARSLDMGADGIMVPRVETLEQLKTAVNAMRFSPIGKKGCGGVALFRAGESIDDFQTGRFLSPQIESPLGIDTLPEMLRVYGDQIAGFVIGPYDMSITVGTPKDIDSPETRRAMRRVIDICKDANKSVGAFCDNVEKAREYHAMGANIFWTASDADCLLSGYESQMAGLRELGE